MMTFRAARLATAAALVVLSAGTVATGAPAATAAQSSGWVRLAHLSPDTPAVDVYLYPYGGSTADIVLRHVGYGVASPYENLPAGLYTVAMRAAGAGATTAPVISTNVRVGGGEAYTVAGLGPTSALQLEVLDDQLTAPSGQASVRVIEASLSVPVVSLSAGGSMIASGLRFPAVTGYRNVQPGSLTVDVTAPAASTSSDMTLPAGSTHTLVVLDGNQSGTPKVLNLTDASGPEHVPSGGVDAGLGGLAKKKGTVAPAVYIWGPVILIGIVLVGVSMKQRRRL